MGFLQNGGYVKDDYPDEGRALMLVSEYYVQHITTANYYNKCVKIILIGLIVSTNLGL